MRIKLLMFILALIISTSIKPATAADFNVFVHLYQVNGVTIGELSFGEQIAFRLQVDKENTVPVMTVQRGKTGTVVSPDIVNGMFLLRFNKD
jgi:hypothetical protein